MKPEGIKALTFLQCFSLFCPNSQAKWDPCSHFLPGRWQNKKKEYMSIKCCLNRLVDRKAVCVERGVRKREQSRPQGPLLPGREPGNEVKKGTHSTSAHLHFSGAPFLAPLPHPSPLLFPSSSLLSFPVPKQGWCGTLRTKVYRCISSLLMLLTNPKDMYEVTKRL